MNFDALGLRAELLRAVREQGYEVPTPIQQKAIKPILEDNDVIATAQTGTGKTAGFTLPLLDQLMEFGGATGKPRALIVAPTRELAAQIGESVATYGKYLPLKHVVIFGGVGMQPQVDALRRGVDIIVATPGRLLDHLGRKTVSLSGIEILVLDEADRMLDMGFIHDIRKLLRAVPQDRQTLLFSATFAREVEQLAREITDDPVTIEVAARNAAADTVEQVVYHVDDGRKVDLLAHLVDDGNWNQVLVFTRTKHGANRLAQKLCRSGIESEAIHGNKSQNARTRALRDFKSGQVRVLVATDIASRGLDIDGLPHVVNFELPNVPEDYVHRIGRTGRAGGEGEAISLVSGGEAKYLRDIEKLLKKRVPTATVEGFKVTEGPRTDAPARTAGGQRGGGQRGGNQQARGQGSGQGGGRRRRGGRGGRAAA